MRQEAQPKRRAGQHALEAGGRGDQDIHAVRELGDHVLVGEAGAAVERNDAERRAGAVGTGLEERARQHMTEELVQLLGALPAGAHHECSRLHQTKSKLSLRGENLQ